MKVLGKVYFKNVINFAVEEFSKLVAGNSSDGKNQKENKDESDKVITKPEMITDKLKLVKFKMGSSASRRP